MSEGPGSAPLIHVDPTFTTAEMGAIFSAGERVRRMLTVQAALARAEAQAGLIPPEHAERIATVCARERSDIDAILQEGGSDGTPVIPLLRRITAEVGDAAARSLHLGATSQDILDTATALQIRDGLALLERQLRGAGDRCATLADEERATPMAGRTLLQQASPIPFGLKAAGWLDAVTRRRERMAALRTEAPAVQLGGAAGTLAALGATGPRVIALLATELTLHAPDLPWHTQRDRIAEVVAALGILSGTVAKIAGDIILLAQTEVGEIAGTPAREGGSSTLPQKRNPVDATFAIAASRVARSAVPGVLSSMEQEHERAAGGWQAEWAFVPMAFEATSAAVARTAAALAGLRVDRARMALNLETTNGLVMAEAVVTALTPRLGRAEAQDIVRRACEVAMAESRALVDVLAADARVAETLHADALRDALDPRRYMGAAEVFIDRALARHRTLE